MRNGLRWNKQRNMNLAASRRSRKNGILLFTLFFASIILLISSRLENEYMQSVRGAFADLAAPVLEAISLPASMARRAFDRANAYLDLFEELDRLKSENQRLQQVAWRAEGLERRLSQMRTLLNAVDEPALGFASGRVIADARGPFARSMLLNIGAENGVKAGYAVINEDGLVGRIVNAGERAARVILLSDLNSRVPVLVGPSASRAVLLGDNSSTMTLQFLPADVTIYPGDEVYTSGHGGLFPRGLRVGVAIKDPTSGLRVGAHAKLDELEYVSVLFFDSPILVSKEADELVSRPASREETKLLSAAESEETPIRAASRPSSRRR